MLLEEALILSLSQLLENHLAGKPHQNRKKFFLCCVVKFVSSTEKRPLFEVKRPCLVFIHDLERGNKFLRLKSCVKFSSNKVEVACCLHLSRKTLKRDRNCHFYIINKQSNHSNQLSPNRSVIIKLADRVVGVRFVNHEYDYRLNCPVTK